MRWLDRPSSSRSLLALLLFVVTCAFGACVLEETDTDDDEDGSGTSTETSNGPGGPGGPGSGGNTGAGGAGSGAQGQGGVQPPACDAFVPRWVEPEVVIGPTGLQNKIVALMDSAQNDIFLTMYQLTCSACVSGLVNAKNRGVNVRVILDYDQFSNNSSKNTLINAGISVKDAPSEFVHAHAKVMVIDQSVALVMSANMNVYSMSSERNYGVIDRDPQDVSQLLAILERDWAGSGAIDTSCTRLIISPENSRARVLELINSATQTLDFEIMYISDSEVKNAIKTKMSQGVQVRVLFAMPEWIDENVATAQELKAAGAQTKYLYTYEIHAKLVVADGVALVASHNMSYNSLENNREVGMLVTETGPAATITQQFATDWAQGTPAP